MTRGIQVFDQLSDQTVTTAQAERMIKNPELRRKLKPVYSKNTNWFNRRTINNQRWAYRFLAQLGLRGPTRRPLSQVEIDDMLKKTTVAGSSTGAARAEIERRAKSGQDDIKKVIGSEDFNRAVAQAQDTGKPAQALTKPVRERISARLIGRDIGIGILGLGLELNCAAYLAISSFVDDQNANRAFQRGNLAMLTFADWESIQYGEATADSINATMRRFNTPSESFEQLVVEGAGGLPEEAERVVRRTGAESDGHLFYIDGRAPPELSLSAATSSNWNTIRSVVRAASGSLPAMMGLLTSDWHLSDANISICRIVNNRIVQIGVAVVIAGSYIATLIPGVGKIVAAGKVSMKKIFELGKTYITSNAEKTLSKDDIDLALSRHESGDWGESSEKELNDFALQSYKARIFSVYRDSKNTTFWVITESNRKITTVLLPEDY
jgi:hypothetical protein